MTASRHYPTRPIVGVGAVIFKDEKILLIRRGKPPKAGEWSLPGGAQDLGETVEQAILREIREETGLEVSLTGFLDVIDYIERDTDTVLFHYTLIDYAAEWVSGALIAASDAASAQFFLLDEALALPLWSETKRIITLAVNHRKLSKDPE